MSRKTEFSRDAETVRGRVLTRFPTTNGVQVQSFSSVIVSRAVSLFRRAALCVAVNVALFAGGSLPAAEFDALRIGFEGRGRVGNSLPIQSEVSGLPQGIPVSLTVTAADPLGNLCLRTVSQGLVDADGRIMLSGTFAAGRLDGSLRVAIVHDTLQEILCERNVPVREQKRNEGTSSGLADELKGSDPQSVLKLHRQSAEVMLCVGEPAGVRDMESAVVASRSDYFAAAVFSLPTLSAFPTTREALDSIDMVYLTDEFGLNPEQSSALQQWVLTGGHLLVSCGSTADQLLATSLGEWLQPQFGISPGVNRVVDLSPVQNFVPGAVQLQTNRFRVPMCRVSADAAKVVIGSLDGPMISRRAVGTGVITFVSVDLNRPPVSNWKSLPRLHELLMFDQPMDAGKIVANRSIRISSSGISDLSTQLTAVCDAIPASQRWSTWHVMALIAVYVLVIGPADYVIVVYLLKKPHMTWVTFPLLILAGCGVICWQAADNPESVTARALHLLDVSQSFGVQTVHERTWVSISAATTRRTDVAVEPGARMAAANPSRFLRWFGRGEDVYGGMYREGGAGLGRQTYRQTGGASPVLEGVPLLASGSQCFFHDAVLPGSPPLFESTLSSTGTGLLEGQVINRLPTAIHDWVVFYGNRVYAPSAAATEEQSQLLPGQAWNRRSGFVRTSDLKSFLNGSRIVPRSTATGSNKGKGESQQLATPYNSRNTDPLDIIMMISLYDAAGSDAYVGLRNDLFRRMEISDSVRMNYAVMLGTIDEPLSQLTCDGLPLNPAASATVVRLLLPVSRDKPAAPAEIRPGNESSPATPEPVVPP